MAAILLALSSYYAYTVFELSSEGEQNPSERAYAVRQDKLVQLRNILNRGQNAARNYLLTWRPNRDNAYSIQLGKLKEESEYFLSGMDQEIGKNSAAELRRDFSWFFNTLGEPLHWNESERRQRSLDLFTQVIPASRQPSQQLVKRLLDEGEAAAKYVEVDRRRQQRHALQLLFLMLAAAFAVLITIGLQLGLNARDLRHEGARKFEQLLNHKRDLEQLSGRLLVVQENERRSLSRELHDGIGQVMTALRVEISLAQSSESADKSASHLARAHSLAEEAVLTTRNIALLLRPSILDDLGLEAALRSQAEEFTRRSQIPCKVSVESFNENLPDSLRTCVYRVAQEALNNCQKHASASSVLVRIKQVENNLTLLVEDDGLGFCVERGMPVRSVGLGIIGMRERAAMFGGTLTVGSQPGLGTRILLTLPIERAMRSNEMQYNPHALGQEGIG